MSAVVAQIDLVELNRPKPINDDVVIGKDVLELLAGAMYADPLTIYREYVQNAADSIDVARDARLSAPEGFYVRISLNLAQRSVLIRDNGASVPQSEFVRRLTSIGASGKRGTDLRGFRGVGRLSGLGYCQEIVFRGRAEGDAKITELRWDVRKLRELLRDASYQGDLSAVVRSICEVRRFTSDEYPSRFFDVELKKVTRLRGDLLLNEDHIRHFLAQVAPVPFHPEFVFAERIQAFLTERGVRQPIDVRIEGDAEPIYHRARDAIPFSEKLIDPVQSVEFLEFLDQDGKVDAFGWVLNHSYLGAVPKRLGFGGIRLRRGNIQVGSDTILAGLYPEARFASWTIGDVHVCSPRILPNARRDEFEAGVAYAHLQDELSIVLKRLTQTIRDQSIGRNRVRKVEIELGLADQWLDEARKQRFPAAVAERVRAIVDTRIEIASKQLAKLPPDSAEAAGIRHRIKIVATRRTKLLQGEERGPGRRSAKDKALDVAINVVLEHAATPHAGITMSKRILKAFDSDDF